MSRLERLRNVLDALDGVRSRGERAEPPGFAVSHAIFLAARALFGLSRAATVLYVLTTLGSGAVGFALRSIGAPKYDARGVLASEGDDLGAAGVTSLMWDAVYLTWAVHVLVALVSRWFWSLYLAIPACASRDGRGGC